MLENKCNVIKLLEVWYHDTITKKKQNCDFEQKNLIFDCRNHKINNEESTKVFLENSMKIFQKLL